MDLFPKKIITTLAEAFLEWFQRYSLERYTQKQLDKQYNEIKEGKETWQD